MRAQPELKFSDEEVARYLDWKKTELDAREELACGRFLLAQELACEGVDPLQASLCIATVPN